MRSRATWALPAAFAAALLVHAHRFDFICDDAFITLRYARNLSALGAPIYNVGERVEGYTNLLWMLLAALGYKLGLGPEAIVAGLGGLSAAVLMAGLWLAWMRLEALPRAAAVFPPAGDLRPRVEVPPRRCSPHPRARTGPRGHTFALAWLPVAPCSCARARPTPPRAPLGRAPARWEAPR